VKDGAFQPKSQIGVPSAIAQSSCKYVMQRLPFLQPLPLNSFLHMAKAGPFRNRPRPRDGLKTPQMRVS
jgi:hypothetical protein